MSEALDLDGARGPRPARLGLVRRPNFNGLWTVFLMTASRMVRARRLLTLCGLYLMPIVLILMIQTWGFERPERLQLTFILGLLPHALVPLTALLYAPGLIQDEVEDQTLTYLLIRPLPRWQVYLAKLAASILVTSMLAATFGALAEVVVWREEPEFFEVIPRYPALLAGMFVLSLTGYNALFGFVGLFIRKSLAFGLLFVLVLEGFFSRFDFVLREATVIYYFRILALRGFGLGDPAAEQWSIDLDLAPTSIEAVARLLTASAVLAIAGAWAFHVREFRVKTPEAS